MANRVPISRGDLPPTGKQLWRIRRDSAVKDVGLLPGRLQMKLENLEQLTRADASDLIEALIPLPIAGAAEQLPDGSFRRVEEDELLPEGVYSMVPWDCPPCLVRVTRSRRTGRQIAIKVKLNWKTGSHQDHYLGTVESLLEGESELGPIRSRKELPHEEVFAFADISNYCLVCGKQANNATCEHV